MNDTIYRQAAIKWCRPEEWGTPDERWRPESEFGAMLEALPSAQQEQRWIPVSERLPQYDGEKYLVTYYAEKIGRTRIGISYCYANREGFWSNIPLGYKVVAWCELPEPYKGEYEENKPT